MKHLAIFWAIFFLIAVFGIRHCRHSIEEYGGVRNIIIDNGKAIKSILKEIEEDEK